MSSDASTTPSSDGSDVFLSFNSEDRDAVRELAQLLEGRGLDVWLDEWKLLPGDRWQVKLEEALTTTKAAVVCLGAAGLGPWEEPEMRVILSQAVRRGIRVVPLLLPGAAEPELPPFLEQFMWLDCRGGWTEENIDRLVAGLRGERAASRPRRHVAGRAAPAKAAAGSTTVNQQGAHVSIGNVAEGAKVVIGVDNSGG